VGFGDHAGIASDGQDIEGAFVTERRTDAAEDARDRLDVVGEHAGLGVEYLLKQVGLAREVGREDLDSGLRIEPANLSDRLGVEPRALVVEVVTGHASDGGVAQLHRLDRFRDATRLVEVQGVGLAGIDETEVAPPRTMVAADEERRLAVLPALEDVRTTGLVARGVQALALEELLQFSVLRPDRGLGLDPRRLLLDGRFGVADLETEEFAALRSDSHVSHPTTGTVVSAEPADSGATAPAC